MTGPVKSPRTWILRSDRHSYTTTLNGQAGTTLEVPYSGSATEPQRADVSLLELRGDQFVADRFEALKLTDGMLVVSDLPAGDYDLLLKKAGMRIRIRMAAGDVSESIVMGSHRQLELRSQQAAADQAPGRERRRAARSSWSMPTSSRGARVRHALRTGVSGSTITWAASRIVSHGRP